MSTLNFYASGHTSFYASRMDQRFSYCAYVPSGHDPAGAEALPVIVLVHGSLRDAAGLRDAFAAFAEAHRCLVLAPLFPCGIGDPEDTHNYKRILWQGIRYDLILLDMIAQAASRYRLRTDRVLMHGFSGGGQFVHRFFYLHPQRLAGVSIGAPGTVTLPDARQWWVGTGGLEAIFGTPLRLDLMAQVPVHYVIGDADTETWDVTVGPRSALWAPGINDSGETRIDRLRSLSDAFAGAGIHGHFDLVPGAGHEAREIHEPVRDFFAGVLRNRTAFG